MKIQVVDDERSITDSLVRIFSNEGCETREVYSAEEARELMLVWSPGFAIIDFHFPQ